MRVGRRKLGEQQQLPGLCSQNFAQSFAVNGDAEALPVKFFMLGDAFRSSVEGHGAASHVQVRAITGCPSHQSVSHVWRQSVHRHLPSGEPNRSEEHTSELQSLMRISYAVFCLKKKTKTNTDTHNSTLHHTNVTKIRL